MVSIVMPAYNEGDQVETSVREWHDSVVSRLTGAEIIVVDDCSKDRTGEVLDALAHRLPSLKVVRPQRNGGHGKAVRLGMHHAARDFVFHTDSDRQHLPEEFWKLWELRNDADFIFGIRSQRRDGAFRVFVTRAMRLLNFMLWGRWVRDANCPFKLMRRSALEAVLQRVPPDSFIPMVMVSILARRLQFRVREVEVMHLPRTGGQQSLQGLVRWAKVGTRCASELIRLRLSI